MRFLVDAAVDVRVARWLAGQGHDAVHLRDRGWLRMQDRDIFAQAAQERRIVLTFDLDFGEIAAYAGQLKTGVVVLRVHDTRDSFVTRRLGEVLASVAAALERGAVTVIEDTRHRVREFPPAR
ncbi:MAG: DUF5615 family PIN-like protein [Planctomycetes bacterium]|nr:DUF5615 family PIN-like protein [Planctomycetota bacterium]